MKDAKAYKFGVEIECSLPNYNYSTFGQKFRGLDCIVKDDPSIRPDESGYEGFEIVTKPLGYIDMQRILSKMCKILDENNVRGNMSCGLHVHISHRKFQITKYLKRVIMVWLAIEDVLFATQPQSRFHNQYSQRLLRTYVSGTFDEMPASKKRLLNKIEGRYYSLNIKNVDDGGTGTLECRLHAYTSNHIKIRNWITLLRCIYSYAIEDTYNSGDVRELFNMRIDQGKIDKTWELIKLPTTLRQFYNARINSNLFTRLAEQQGKAIEYEQMIDKKKRIVKKYERANSEMQDFRDAESSITSAFSR